MSNNANQAPVTDDDSETPVECDHCGYEWEYSGQLGFATCPSCTSKTAVEPNEN